MYCLHTQHLTAESKNNNLSQIVRDTGVLHSTAIKTSYLSLLARMEKFDPDEFETALYEQHSLARIKCIRRSVFVIPADMVAPFFCGTKNMLALKPKHYEPYLQMSQDEYGVVAKNITDLISGQKMSAKEIKDTLDFDKSLSGVINTMCDQGLLIRQNPTGGWKSNTVGYSLFSEVFPQVDLNLYDEFEAREIILKYYLDSYGPATIEDAVWWTGFRKTEVKKVFAGSEIAKIVVSGLEGEYFITQNRLEKLKSFSRPEKDQTALLPFLDPYIMGYKNRERYMDMAHRDYIFDKSGNGSPTILVNGRVVGIWDFQEKPGPVVKLYFFKPVEDRIMESIIPQAKQMGAFLAGQDVEIKLCTDMVPLSQRTAGSFMAPLKDSESNSY